MDRTQCTTCPFQALDLSPALFGFLAPISAGEIYGEWTYDNAPEPSPVLPSTTTSAMPESPTTNDTDAGTVDNGVADGPIADGPITNGPIAQLGLFICEVGVMLLEASNIAGLQQ
jgi:hypothetical protein